MTLTQLITIKFAKYALVIAGIAAFLYVDIGPQLLTKRYWNGYSDDPRIVVEHIEASEAAASFRATIPSMQFCTPNKGRGDR